VRSLTTAAPTLADALELGTPVLRRTVELNRRLKPTFQALQRFAADPLASLGLNDLANTSRVLSPTISNLKPAQTVCNYVSLWFRNVSSLLSVGDRNGTGQRFIIVATPQGPNNEGAFSAAPANGPNRENYLHTNAYPNVSAPGQTQECEAANETYAAGSRSSATSRATRARAPRRRGSTGDDRPLQAPRAAQGPHGGQPAAGRHLRGGHRLRGDLLRLHEEQPVRQTRSRSGRSSSRRSPSARTRPCASRASTSARSRRSSARRARTPQWSSWRSRRRALPIHKDATLKIRPRIFLEGNFFVDVRPGTPRRRASPAATRSR
jgi:hypothetical protein